MERRQEKNQYMYMYAERKSMNNGTTHRHILSIFLELFQFHCRVGLELEKTVGEGVETARVSQRKDGRAVYGLFNTQTHAVTTQTHAVTTQTHSSKACVSADRL